jgi:hypothetical protein
MEDKTPRASEPPAKAERDGKARSERGSAFPSPIRLVPISQAGQVLIELQNSKLDVILTLKPAETEAWLERNEYAIDPTGTWWHRAERKTK